MTLLSYAVGSADGPMLGETIGANLDRTAARVPGAEALVDVPTGRRWTYRELLADVEGVARGLLARGIAKGDRVGIWAPNCPEWTILQYATAKIGAILVNINPAYRTHELAYVLEQAGVGLLVAAERLKTSDYRAMVREVRPGLADVVFIDSADWAALGVEGASEAALREREAALAFDDPINIQYTSGTTGFPKGATLSHHNILNNGFFVAATQGRRSRSSSTATPTSWTCR
jgi:fatty-acyl-CoA synthase